MKRSTRRYAALLPALLLLVPVALTGCSSAEGPATEAYEALQAEFDAGMENTETMEQYTEVIGTFKPRYEAFAEEHWGTEAAFDAKLWTMQMGTVGMEDDEREAAMTAGMDALFTEYMRSEKLSDLAFFYNDLSAERQEWLMEGSPHATVRAATVYYLARDADFQISYGSDVDVEALTEQRKQYLDMLVEDYHDTPLRESTYGVMAEAMLSAHDPSVLAIGQKAPEIIGADVDGNEMKLSDYLGKVVVLDFWGDW